MSEREPKSTFPSLGEVGIGLPGDTQPGTVAKVAALAERLGLASF